jgi:Protein  of unknown function (DUF3018)
MQNKVATAEQSVILVILPKPEEEPISGREVRNRFQHLLQVLQGETDNASAFADWISEKLKKGPISGPEAQNRFRHLLDVLQHEPVSRSAIADWLGQLHHGGSIERLGEKGHYRWRTKVGALRVHEWLREMLQAAHEPPQADEIPPPAGRQPVGDKFRRYREAKQRRGMRLLRIWVPDPRRPEFAAEAERQAELLRERPEEREALDFIEAAFDWPDP